MGSDLTIYPIIVPTGHSPATRFFTSSATIEKVYLVDIFTTMSDHSLDTFFDKSYFDCAVSLDNFPADLDLDLDADCFSLEPARPFGQLDNSFASDFSFSMDSALSPNMPISPCDSTISSAGSTTTLGSESKFALPSCKLGGGAG
ncbi:hypothetical protein P154DRAFT_39282 [Amniculicola lignicola CBS 123094]|uniref:Uncharacterized protein n=1 Tax=Amniculicola lignicola CBS 123094 TaxID=1392246 RepID=A0A6A5W1T2_9PLEO|nr:hypothetical protein P154DRAFT_39282 [Amniculicola lignicola CBS 123094]